MKFGTAFVSMLRAKSTAGFPTRQRIALRPFLSLASLMLYPAKNVAINDWIPWSANLPVIAWHRKTHCSA